MIRGKNLTIRKTAFHILTAFHLVNITHLSMNNKTEGINSHLFQLSGFIAGKT